MTLEKALLKSSHTIGKGPPSRFPTSLFDAVRKVRFHTSARKCDGKHFLAIHDILYQWISYQRSDLEELMCIGVYLVSYLQRYIV